MRGTRSACRRATTWRSAEGKVVRTLVERGGKITGVAITPDGRLAVSSEHGGRSPFFSREAEDAPQEHVLRVFEIDSGRERQVLRGHTEGVNGVAVTPDGRLVISASSDWTLKVWEFASGKEFYTITGHESIVNGMTISPDGRFAVSYSADGTLIAWDISTGETMSTLSEHTAVIYSIAVTPDCRFVVLASVDETLKVWDIASQQLVATFRGEGGFNTCAVAPDNTTILAGDRSGGVHFLRLDLPENVAGEGGKF